VSEENRMKKLAGINESMSKSSLRDPEDIFIVLSDIKGQVDWIKHDKSARKKLDVAFGKLEKAANDFMKEYNKNFTT